MPIVTLNSNIGDMSDHHVFRTNGVPYLFLSCGRWEHYHQPSDTPARLNYAKMARICELLVGLVAALTGASLVRPLAGGTPVVCDTAGLELRLFREAFGPLMPKLLATFGLEQLETREDLDNLAAALQWLI